MQYRVGNANLIQLTWNFHLCCCSIWLDCCALAIICLASLDAGTEQWFWFMRVNRNSIRLSIAQARMRFTLVYLIFGHSSNLNASCYEVSVKAEKLGAVMTCVKVDARECLQAELAKSGLRAISDS